MLPGEVIVNGVPFPIEGINGFRRQLVTPFPPKLVIGDVNKDDEQYLSTFIQNDCLGGVGLFRILDRSQTERNWFSWLNTSYRSGITLPDYVSNYGTPAGVTNTCPTYACDFGGHVYVVWGSSVFQLADSPTDGSTGLTNWTSALYTAASPIFGMVSFAGYLYVLESTKIKKSADGVAWTDDAGVGAGGGTFLCLHDAKVWRYDAGVTYQQATIGGTWAVNSATLNSPYDVTNMIDYLNALGDPTLHIVTTGGLYSLDESAAPPVWSKTQLTFPPQARAGEASDVYRGDLYLGNGLDMYRYAAGNPATIDVSMGLSRDEGVPLTPINLDGGFIKFDHGLNDLIAQVDQSLGSNQTTSEITGRLAIASPLRNPATFNLRPDNSTYIMRFNGSGWSTIWQSPGAPTVTPCGGLFVSGTPTPRIFWSWNGSYYSVKLQKGIRQPWQNASTNFQAGPLEHWTPWFQGLAESLTKTGVSLKLLCQNMSPLETITCYYATDYETGWHAFPSDSFPDNVVSTNGFTTLPMGLTTDSSTNASSYLGQPYNAIRFKFVFNRGSDSTLSPVLFYWMHQFIKVLPSRWGFTITTDLTEDYAGRTPKLMIDSILSSIAANQLVSFSFHDPGSPGQITYAVKVTHCQSREMTGISDYRGKWDISFIQPGGLD